MAKAVNADVVSAALSQMLDIAMDRENMQSVRLSILKRKIVSLMSQIENQAAETEVFILDGELGLDDAFDEVLSLPLAFDTREAAQAYVETRLPLWGSHSIQRVPIHANGGRADG